MRKRGAGVLMVLLVSLLGCDTPRDGSSASASRRQPLSTAPQPLRARGLSSGEGTQTRPIIAAGDGEWLVVWHDARAERSRRRDLYAARVSFDGGLRDPLGIPLSATPTDMYPLRGTATALWTGSEWDVAWVETEEGGPLGETRLLRATLWPDGGVGARILVARAQAQTRLQDLHLVPTGGVPALTYTSEWELMGSFGKAAPRPLGLLSIGVPAVRGHEAVWDGQRVLVTLADGLGGLQAAYVDADGGLIAGADGGVVWTLATGVNGPHVATASPDAGVLVAYPRQVGANPVSINGLFVTRPWETTTVVLANTTSTNLAATELDVASEGGGWVLSWQVGSVVWARDLPPGSGGMPFQIATWLGGSSGPHHLSAAPGQLAVVASHFNGDDTYWVTLERYGRSTRMGAGVQRVSHTVPEAAPGVACGATTCMVGYAEQQERFLAPLQVALLDFDGGLQGTVPAWSSAKCDRALLAAVDGGFLVSAMTTFLLSSGVTEGGSTRVIMSTALTQSGRTSNSAYANNDVATYGDSAIRFGNLGTGILVRELLPDETGASTSIASLGPVAVATRQRDALGVIHALDGGAIVSVLLAANGSFGPTAVLSAPMGLNGLRKAAVASDGARYLVAWEEPVDGGRAIVGRFVAADGGAGPGPFAVSSRPGWHRAPAATFVNGRYLVGWEYAEDQFAQTDLQYVLLDREGRPQVDPLGGIVAASHGFEHGLTVTPLGTDGVFATWVRVDESLPGAEPYVSFIPIELEPDAGAGGGSAGGSAAGGSAAGGSAAGGSAAGGSAAGGSAAGGSAAGGSAAGGSAAGGSTAGGSAGGSTAGGSAGGSTAGGSAVGSTAGGSAGGSAAGGLAGGSTAGGLAGSSSGGSGGGSAGGSGQSPSAGGCGCSSPSEGSAAWLFGALALAWRSRRR